jgi:hypothetical protein
MPLVARPEALMNYGAVHLVNGQSARMEKVAAGSLEVTSGAIAICGICTGEWSPDSDPRVPVANGLYEIALSQLRWQNLQFGEMRGVTAVTISAANDVVEQWVRWAGPGGRHQVLMEYGIGAVFDPTKSDIADILCSGTGSMTVEPLFEYTTDPWYMWHEGVVAFRGGHGDDMYDVWIGNDRTGHTVALVIDLALLD